MTLMEISEGRAIGAEAVLGNDKAVERAVQMQKGWEARGTGQQVMFSFLIMAHYKRTDMMWQTSVESHRPQGSCLH